MKIDILKKEKGRMMINRIVDIHLSSEESSVNQYTQWGYREREKVKIEYLTPIFIFSIFYLCYLWVLFPMPALILFKLPCYL